MPKTRTAPRPKKAGQLRWSAKTRVLYRGTRKGDRLIWKPVRGGAATIKRRSKVKSFGRDVHITAKRINRKNVPDPLSGNDLAQYDTRAAIKFQKKKSRRRRRYAK